MGLSYRDAGVDIDAGNRAVQLIKGMARRTFRPEVVTDLGSFGGMFALGRYENPVLVSSVDGVGTKLKIAILMDKHDSIGKDIVNHCVNDILTCGAEPLFFMDYFATGQLVPEQMAQVVSGIASACEDSNCALLGGETAEMPGIYAVGDYDLAGFIVGIVERGRVLDGRTISVGDAIVALPSSGLHTNGYSLARRILGLTDDPAIARQRLSTHWPELGRSLGEELLEPHRCYFRGLKPFLGDIKGLAHITGGGLVENVPRVLPPGLCAHFDAGSWTVPPIFSAMARLGGVAEDEMYRVFNMGLGMVIICAQSVASSLMAGVPGAIAVGEIRASRNAERVTIE